MEAGSGDRLQRETMTFDPITDDAKPIPPVMSKPNTTGTCTYTLTGRLKHTALSSHSCMWTVEDKWDNEITKYLCAHLNFTHIFHNTSKLKKCLYLSTLTFQAIQTYSPTTYKRMYTKCSNHIYVLPTKLLVRDLLL